MSSRRPHPATLTAVLVYLATAMAMGLEQWGRITTDNRLELSTDPAGFWWANFTLWDPETSLGEVHNQVYGYLFPQGAFFAGLDWIGLPAWVSERVWSLLVVVVAAEGCRRLARAFGLGPWPATVAGLAFGFDVRIVAEVGVRSAEILPSALVPLVALPIVHALNGRLGARSAAVLSAAAFACGGAANATATVAVVPLLAILLLWGVRTGRCRWSLPVWWAGVMVLVNAWWMFGLLALGRYSAPFFDYVEDARTATSLAGASASLRGASNWVNIITAGNQAWWPAGHDLTTTPWLVVVTGLVAVGGLLGLVTLKSPYRTPLGWSAAVGFCCLTVGISATAGSPIAGEVRSLLDGPLVALRNVHKIDPVLRVPLSLGLGALVAAASTWWSGRFTRKRTRTRRRDRTAPIAVLAVAVVLAAATPVWAGNLRTPGFRELPSYWQAAADYLDEHDDGGRTWLIPGTGFALQNWGWSFEEPLGVIGEAPWVTRSQVPLVPASTIRMLSSLESLIETGAGSPRLGAVLTRLGISHVLVRHDLDLDVTDATTPALVSTAIARSGGVRRVQAFGTVGQGVAIEIFEVTTEPVPDLQVRRLADTVTVAGSAGDVVTAVSQGLIGAGRAALVRGDDGWDAPAQLVGDAYRLRERTFGRVHDAESSMMSADDDYRLERRVTDYPGPSGAAPTVVRYDGIDNVVASSSLGYVDNYGEIRPENGPYSALDGDTSTSWRSASYLDPRDQWLRVAFEHPHRLDTVSIRTPLIDLGLDALTAVTFEAGAERVTADVDVEGVATADLGGVIADRLTVRVAGVAEPDSGRPVGISELTVPGLEVGRTVVLREVPTANPVDWVFTAKPETRSCQQTLFGPDCQLGRYRPGEETAILDRTITVEADGSWGVDGEVMARSQLGSMTLTQPLYGVQLHGSSVFTNDPAVSWRMAADGLEPTSWIADLGDPAPTLDVTWPERVRLDRLTVTPPPPPAVPPTRAVITSGQQRRVVDLRGLGVFPVLHATHVAIEFSHPGVDNVPIGVAEVHLSPGDATNPFDGENPTGAFCGYGPPVIVDGTRHETRVEGLMGDVISAGPLRLVPCGGRLRLSTGEHRIQVLPTSQFQPIALTLTQSGRPAPQASRSLRVVSRTDSRIVADLGAGDAAILSTDWNANPGWTATLDGARLIPQTVDGWAQGWIVPAGRSGDLVIEFAPQRWYAVALAAGLGLLALVLLVALGLLALTRLSPPLDPSAAAGGRPRRTRFLGYAGVLVGAGVLGGPPLAGGVLLGLVLLRLRRVWALIAGLLGLAAVVAAGVGIDDRGAVLPRWVDVITLVFVGVVLVRVLATRPHPPPAIEGEAG